MEYTEMKIEISSTWCNERNQSDLGRVIEEHSVCVGGRALQCTVGQWAREMSLNKVEWHICRSIL